MTAQHNTRRVLLGTATICIVAAGGLFLQHALKPSIDFYPPDEDICIVPPQRVSLAHPWNPDSRLGRHDARPIPADARCPVCGMYPARYPQWAAQLIFEDGSAYFFDSPVDLYMFLDDPVRFDPDHAAKTVAAIYVADFRGSGWLDAQRASFVIGSAARGPMRGPDLPAFADGTAANAFIAENGGRMLTHAEIDAATVAKLRDANHADHTH